MNQENVKSGAGKTIAGILLSFVLAFFTPIILMTEALSLIPVIMLPAIGIVLLHRWAGKIPAMLCGILQLMVTSMMMGSTFMWIVFFTNVLPASLIIRNEKKVFYHQIKAAIAAFCGGSVAGVAVLYFSYGGNMIQRLLLSLPQVLEGIPEEALAVPMQNLGAALGSELTPESFYNAFNEVMKSMAPVYSSQIPGFLLAGALGSAVFAAWLSATMLNRRGLAVEGSWIPVREWALPSSTTSGLIMMFAASYAIYALGMTNGETVFVTVDSIVMMAFSVQAVASISRRLHAVNMKKGAQIAILVLILLACMLGAINIVGIYGVASALFGSKGSFRQRLENKNKQSDDENRGGT